MNCEIDTIKNALQTLTERLISRSSTPRLDIELLLSHILKKSRCSIYARPEFVLSNQQQQDLFDCFQRRLAGEPLSYILGQKEFWSFNFKVDPGVLVPRPETEHLVELTLQCLPEASQCHVADLGTGSGNIAIALGKTRPHWRISACDQSTAALDIAQSNINALKANNVHCYQGDWFAALPNNVSFHAIVSNPPYLAHSDAHLPTLRHEPIRALVAGDDGLQAFREIIATAPRYLHPEGWLLLEHGCDQGHAVQTLLEKGAFKNITTQYDLAGLARVTIARCRA